MFRQNAVERVVAAILRSEARRLQREGEVEQAMNYRAVLSNADMFAVFVAVVTDRFETSETPIRDAIADLIRDFIENPGKWKEIIEWLIGLFSSF